MYPLVQADPACRATCLLLAAAFHAMASYVRTCQAGTTQVPRVSEPQYAEDKRYGVLHRTVARRRTISVSLGRYAMPSQCHHCCRCLLSTGAGRHDLPCGNKRMPCVCPSPSMPPAHTVMEPQAGQLGRGAGKVCVLSTSITSDFSIFEFQRCVSVVQLSIILPQTRDVGNCWGPRL